MSTQTESKLVTQIDFARAGQITPQMKEVAEREHRDPEYIRERVADGRIAIPANIVHIKKGMRAFGVGEGLSTKVNVNLGISGDKADAAAYCAASKDEVLTCDSACRADVGMNEHKNESNNQ